MFAEPRLVSDERPPFHVLNPGARAPFVLIADHAGREIPEDLGDLGLTAAELERHIAWDIGVARLGAHLARELGACFVAQRYSRLVIDCNRDPERADAVCEVSDGTSIPGNLRLSAAGRRQRVEQVFAPYQARIAEELDARAAAGLGTILVALHSFTPVMAGFARPWRYGVLHLGGSAACEAALAALRARVDPALVGDNEPYTMDGTDFTIPHHALPRGLDYIELEVRQDLIGDEAGAAREAALVAEVLRAIAA
jgi:predicted N-formylglutamate amidohydrolase